MTKQEIFNHVWNYFVIEKHGQSFSTKRNKCAYYDSVSRSKCAIGCLFSDEIAQSIQNKYGSKEIDVIMLDCVTLDDHELQIFDGIDVAFLKYIQCAHDNSVSLYYLPIENWCKFQKRIRSKLLDIAAIYHLDIPTETT